MQIGGANRRSHKYGFIIGHTWLEENTLVHLGSGNLRKWWFSFFLVILSLTFRRAGWNSTSIWYMSRSSLITLCLSYHLYVLTTLSCILQQNFHLYTSDIFWWSTRNPYETVLAINSAIIYKISSLNTFSIYVIPEYSLFEQYVNSPSWILIHKVIHQQEHKFHNTYRAYRSYRTYRPKASDAGDVHS